ncbi:hypothetical protein QBC44DRAFT_373195 [Cladorrhinum sp. PSN332]|nr:hypothetical protein QBC44DRAFT_373195 [Cladorrhinum sp. PSN332]
MNSLPAELTDMIISYLPDGPLANYATVSQQWQQAIEDRTFASITVSSDVVSFGGFKSAFACNSRHGPRRQHIVRSIQFRVILPSPSDKRLHKMQSTKEAAENNVVYTRAMVDMFSFLSAWPAGRYALAISARSLRDDYQGNMQWASSGIWTIRNNFEAVGFDANVLASIPGGKLAEVQQVHELACASEWRGRRIAPAVLGVLGKALPNIEQMEFCFYPVGRRLMDLRRVERSSLANALLSLETNLNHLTSLKLEWQDSDPLNQQFPPGNMIDQESGGRDTLSVALRRVSQLPSLRKLELEGSHILTPEIFDDMEGRDSGAWPSLEILWIYMMSTTTPDGGWYVTGDPNSEEPGSEDGDSSDYEAESVINSDDSDVSDFAPERKWERRDGMSPAHEFRALPNEEKFVPFMLAMTKAIARMPKIRNVEVVTHPMMTSTYYAPGEHIRTEDSVLFSGPRRNPRWVFYLEQGFVRWDFPTELKDALTQEVGAGNVLVRRLGSSEYGVIPLKGDEVF